MIKGLLGNPLAVRLVSAAQGRLHPWYDRLGRFFAVRLVVRTFQEMSADDATHMAAGVAFYAFFSLFPLLLGLTAVLSLFTASETVQSDLTDFVSEYLPGSKELIAYNLDVVTRLRGALGIFALLGLLWSGSAVFGAVTRAVNRAWDVATDRPIYIGKPRQLLMALGVGILFFLSLGAASLVRVAEELGEREITGVGFLFDTVGRFLLQGTSFLLTLCIFLLIYKFLPNTKTYWRFIWPGAIVAAVLFEFTKGFFLTYVDRFANFEHIYGSLAPVIGLLLWVYVSSLVLILGAEISSEYGRLRRNVERGVVLHPKPGSMGPEGSS